MQAFVKKAWQEVNLALQDEFPQQRHRSFRRVGHYAVPAIREPFELHEARRKLGSDIGLAFDRVHRIVFTPDHQGRTPDPVKLREHVERIALGARFGEPLRRHLRTADGRAYRPAARAASSRALDIEGQPRPVHRYVHGRGLP